MTTCCRRGDNMRVAIDGMLLGRRSSGVEGSIANLVRALAASGSNDYWLYSQVDPSSLDALPGHLNVATTRWPVRSRAVRIFWQQAVLPSILARGRFDLLHAPGYIAPVLAPVPVVTTIYDVIALSHPSLCTPANHWHYRFLLPLSVRKAAAVIVPSLTTRDDLARYMPAAAGKIRVIPLGVGSCFAPTRDAGQEDRLRADYGLGEPFILFVGGLEPKKNVEGLIAAYRLLRQRGAVTHRLVIAGALSWDHARVRRAIRESGLGDAVTLTGFIPPERLPALYRAASLFVFPSLYEGFGLPPLEAMACGTPVIVSNRGALPETAGPAALVTDPLAPERLAEAMETVLTRMDVRGDLVARGLRHAAQFSWSRTASATETVYAEVAGRECAP